jgi:multiple sugar transport system permease protein
MMLMIFSTIAFWVNFAVISDVIGANMSAERLGYTKMGMHYLVPIGTYALMLLSVIKFVLVKIYRKKLLIEKGLYIKMTKKEKIENLKGFAYISPFIIGFVCFTAIPLIFSFFSSFTFYNITSVQKWYGLNNFINLSKSEFFWIGLYNTVWYVVVSVPLAIIFALLSALLMNMKSIKGLRYFRTVYYLPSVLSGIAVFLLWQWLLEPSVGLINNVLGLIGIQGPSWLYDPIWTKPALVLIKLWGVGGNTIILLSALQAVPAELYEAATIDGATGYRKFTGITLPMISPTLFFIMVTGVSGAFQVFDSAFLLIDMTGTPGTGGPNNSLLFYNLQLYYSALRDQQMGVASTMAWILFVIIMLFTIAQMAGSRRWVYYEGEIDRK